MPPLKFPSFQALCKADVFSTWVVLVHLAFPACLCGQLNVCYLSAYIPIGKTRLALLLEKLMEKIAAAASSLSGYGIGNCDHWHLTQCGHLPNKLQK